MSAPEAALPEGAAGAYRGGRGEAGADGIEIRALRTPGELQACVALQGETWGGDFSELVPVSILRIAQWVGGVAAGAFDRDGVMLGFVFGMAGVEEGVPIHWSDMLAVRPGHRDRHLGERLKRWQREAVMATGARRMYWSFDPLESRNAYLNFGRLGAEAWEYVPNMYGETDSPLHRGIGTDRLIAVWELDSTRVARRLAGAERPPGPAEVAAAPLVNPVVDPVAGAGADVAVGPRGSEPDLEVDAPRVRVAVPAEIQTLKASAPELAAEWRRQTRAALLAYLGRGYRATELVREAGWSAYLLERAPR